VSASRLEAKAKANAKKSKLAGHRPRYETIKTAATDEHGENLRAGLWWLGQDKEGGAVNVWLSSPIEAIAKTSDQEGNNHGLALSFVADGVWRDWVMPKHLLAEGRNAGWFRALLDRGVKFDPNQIGRFESWLHSTEPSEKKTATNRTGWTEDRSSFVLTNQTLGDQQTVFQSAGLQTAQMRQKGEAKAWRDEISVMCKGNPLLMLACSAALAGPLLRLVGVEYGAAIFHLVGASSTGKSTACMVAGSVYGGPEYVSSWRATDNGLEGVATSRNDAVLCLDDVSQCDPRKAGQIAYMIGNGQGKQRMTAEVLTREPLRWRLMAVSSGEHSLEAELRKAGGQINAGQEVRMLTIPVVERYGLFDNLHGFDSGAKLSDHLKASCGKHYGTAGPAFIASLLNMKDRVSDRYQEIKADPRFHSEDGLEKRAGDWFALAATAGELATLVGVVNWSDGEATKAAAYCFDLWRENRGGGSTEARQIKNSIRAFIDAYGESRFTPSNTDHPPRSMERAGWYEPYEPNLFDEDAPKASRVWLFTTEALREAGGGFDLQTVARVLDDAGWIVKKDGSRLQALAWIGQPPRLNQSAKRVYWVAVPDED